MSGNADQGTRLLGVLGSADGKGVVRVADRLDATIDDVWQADRPRRRLQVTAGRRRGLSRPGGRG
jgi:hypothetical protein